MVSCAVKEGLEPSPGTSPLSVHCNRFIVRLPSELAVQSLLFTACQTRDKGNAPVAVPGVTSTTSVSERRFHSWLPMLIWSLLCNAFSSQSIRLIAREFHMVSVLCSSKPAD